MFGAIKQPNGKYTITEVFERKQGHFQSKTFHIKDKLKMMGGRWNPKTKLWEDVDEIHLKDIPAEKRLKVRIAPHSQVSSVAQDIFVYPSDIENNCVSELTMGDDHVWVPIEEVYGEG